MADATPTGQSHPAAPIFLGQDGGDRPGPRPDWQTHALFLDFDGTLAPLVARPEDARPAPATIRLLTRLRDATDGAMAILSGRALADLSRQLGEPALALSGSHGLEMRLPDGRDMAPGHGNGALAAAFAEIAPVATDAGLLVEDKPGSVALHYRNRPDLAATCQALVARVAAAHGLRALHGHMVSEAALSGIDKGTALRRFMDLPAFAGRIPVMIGDDTTDEDGFRAAQDLGGFGLRIGEAETLAQYRVPQMDDALSWLAGTLDLSRAAGPDRS